MIKTAKTENGWVRGISAADPRIIAYKDVPFARTARRRSAMESTTTCERLGRHTRLFRVCADIPCRRNRVRILISSTRVNGM